MKKKDKSVDKKFKQLNRYASNAYKETMKTILALEQIGKSLEIFKLIK